MGQAEHLAKTVAKVQTEMFFPSVLEEMNILRNINV